MSTYAVIIGVDTPPVMVPYEGFAALKRGMGCDMAEVATRATISDIRVLMLVDEEGLLKDAPTYNDLASIFRAAVQSRLFEPEPLVGVAAVLKDTDEDFVGLSEEEAREIVSYLEALQ